VTRFVGGQFLSTIEGCSSNSWSASILIFAPVTIFGRPVDKSVHKADFDP
jgi:hypothetical protein